MRTPEQLHELGALCATLSVPVHCMRGAAPRLTCKSAADDDDRVAFADLRGALFAHSDEPAEHRHELRQEVREEHGGEERVVQGRTDWSAQGRSGRRCADDSTNLRQICVGSMHSARRGTAQCQYRGE